MKKNRKLSGLPPGSVVFTGDQKVEEIGIHYLKYDKNQLNGQNLKNGELLELPFSSPEIVELVS